MPEEYSNNTGGAGTTVKGRPLDEDGSRGWEEGGVSEKNSEAAASRSRFRVFGFLILIWWLIGR